MGFWPKAIEGRLQMIRFLIGFLTAAVQRFDIAHELTDKGIQKFVADYQGTLKPVR